MPSDFAAVFASVKPVLVKYGNQLRVKVETPIEYTLVTKSGSPFPQHKGQPLFFGSIRLGKAYVSFHLMPIYMSPTLTKKIAPGLKKHMQGKACFNFKTVPEPDLLAELEQITEAAFEQWRNDKWL